MDYRNLLVRYLGHILDQEGTTSIDTVGATIHFTPEEKTELRTLEREARIALRR
jgi:hypothetical protein